MHWFRLPCALAVNCMYPRFPSALGERTMNGPGLGGKERHGVRGSIARQGSKCWMALARSARPIPRRGRLIQSDCWHI